MSILVIGDLHAKHQDLRSMADLLGFISKESHNHTATVLMGDIFHDHGITRADVFKAMWDFVGSCKNVIIVTGNHDILSDNLHSSLYPFKEICKVVSSKEIIELEGQKFGVVPFIRDQQVFESECSSLNGLVETIFCHQEFNGAQFENGFFSKHGAKTDCFNGMFVSGHIHMPYNFENKVLYVGACRWIHSSDKDQDRFVWKMYLSNGKISKTEKISVRDLCPAFVSLVFREDGKLEQEKQVKSSDKIFAEYMGSDPAVVKDIKKKYKNITIKTIAPTKKKNKHSVSESKGFFVSLKEVVNRRDLGDSEKDYILAELNRRFSL
jgi:predicted phosphodiesterase